MIINKFAQIIFILFIGVILTLPHTSNLNAQDSASDVIFRGGVAQNMAWSPNSDQIIFTDNNMAGIWYQYDLVRKTLRENEIHPFRFTTTSDDINRLNIAQSPTSDDYAPVFQSPDEQILVYAGEVIQKPTEIYWKLNISDNQKNIVYETSEIIINPFRASIMWSQDSTSFIITDYYASEHPRFLYGSNFSENVKEGVIVQINIKNVQEDLYIKWDDTVYAILNDGSHILLHVSLDDPLQPNPYQHARSLVVWNVHDYAQSHVLDNIDINQAIGAGFQNNDPNLILYINDRGLMRYNISENKEILITDEIRASSETYSYPELALFSPNGKFVAIRKPTDDGSWEIHLIELSSFYVD